MNKEYYKNDKKGRESFFKQLTLLLDYNADFENKSFKDIHISQSDSDIKLEWENVYYSGDCEGFVFLNGDEVIMKEITFPDGHYDYVLPDNVDEAYRNWHKNHPEWKLTTYGTWTNVEENRIQAIDYYMGDWTTKEVKDSDSTFATEEFQCTSEANLTQALMCLEDSVLRRTDYIVVGPDSLWLCMNNGTSFDDLLEINKDLKDNDLKETTLRKVGEYNLCLSEDQNGFKSIIHVYYDYQAKNSIYFLTDNNYLIFRLDVNKVGR